MHTTADALQTCPSCGHESRTRFATCPACGRGYYEPAGAAAPSARGAGGEARVCYKCDYEVGDAGAKLCPRCGNGRILKRRQVRGLGWVLLFAGAFLFLFMGGITVFVAYLIAQTGEPGSTMRFTGGKREAAVVFGIFGAVMAFGLASMAAGVSQIRRRRRNKGLVRVMVWLFIALVVLAELIYFIL